MGEGQGFELALDRLDHRAVGMSEAADRGAAGGVEIAAAFAVVKISAVARHRDRIAVQGIAMEDMAHRLAMVHSSNGAGRRHTAHSWFDASG